MRRKLLWVLFALALVLAPGLAFAGESETILPPFTQQDWTLVYIVLASAFVALGYGLYLARKTTRHDPGTPAMQDVSAALATRVFARTARPIPT